MKERTVASTLSCGVHGGRIAIEVRRPEQDKADNDAHAKPDQPAPPHVRIALVNSGPST